MKQCPLCNRTYADDLNFCLEDGAVLRVFHDDEITRVSPAPPLPATPPNPVPPQPIPATPPRRGGWTALAAVAVILFLLLGGGIIFALWSINREDHPAESSSTPLPSYRASASPGSSPVPLCEVLKNCPTPTPTPTLTPSPSPSPSVSPSPTRTEPAEQSLTAGTYQSERTIESEGRSALLRIRFSLNSDGTYLEQAYVTFHGTGISDLLGVEEKGNVSQSNGQLILNSRTERKLDFETSSWSDWHSLEAIRQSIRNVTSTTFQMYDESDKAWFTFSKP